MFFFSFSLFLLELESNVYQLDREKTIIHSFALLVSPLGPLYQLFILPSLGPHMAYFSSLRSWLKCDLKVFSDYATKSSLHHQQFILQQTNFLIYFTAVITHQKQFFLFMSIVCLSSPEHKFREVKTLLSCLSWYPWHLLCLACSRCSMIFVKELM